MHKKEKEVERVYERKERKIYKLFCVSESQKKEKIKF